MPCVFHLAVHPKTRGAKGGTPSFCAFLHFGRCLIRCRDYTHDGETGFYSLNSRYYDPEIGRFINADGLVATGQGLLGNNMFAYCLNNPVMNVDPSGHAVITASSILIGIAIVAACAALGAISGGAISGINYLISTDTFVAKDFWASVAGGAVSGAIMGAFTGIILITGASGGAMVAASAGAGALAGLAGSVAEGAINGELQEDWKSYLLQESLPSAIWGAAAGALFGLMSGASPSAKSLAEKSGRTITKQLSKILVHKVLKKTGSNLGENLLWDTTAWGLELFTDRFARMVLEIF